MCVVFFCKQKTAYEMRISDWSSDVCSSDLADAERLPEKDTVTSAPTNLVLQTPGLPSPSGFGDKRASAGKGNGLDDLGQRQPHEAGSSDSRGGDALPKLSGPFAKLFKGENRLSKRQRLLLIFSGTLAIIFSFGALVKIVLDRASVV